MDGWIKLNRKLIDSVCFKNSEMLHVWVFLLLDANHRESKVPVGNQIITIQPGQMLTSRKRIVEATGINRSKVERILTLLKSEQQIEQQSFTKYRIISIVKWSEYQNCEQQNEQQMSSRRATDEHIQECKEVKEENILSLKLQACFEQLWKAYPDKDGKKESLKHFNATVKTLEDGFKIEAALENYLAVLDKAHTQGFNRRPKGGKVWFNNWQDWIPEDFGAEDDQQAASV